MKANLYEVMESIQGEGLLLGTRQVFLRFTGCNLRCSYCDTAASLQPAEQCLYYRQTGIREVIEQVDNPLSQEEVASLVRAFSSSWISLTGGEPLLWADFIAGLASLLKPFGYSFLLETNGTLHEQLDICLPFIDMISMDFKLSSDVFNDCWSMHERFLCKAAQKPCYIKLVLTTDSSSKELAQAVQLIARINKDIPLILQPVTQSNDCYPPLMEDLLEMQKTALKILPDVRIIPQLHPLMGLI